MIGIGLYIYTQNTRWLILFFDFMKEYLIYIFLAKNDLSYIWFFILLKIYFEVWSFKLGTYLVVFEYYFLMFFLQGFLGSCVSPSPPSYIKSKGSETFTPVDTIQQYLDHFNTFRKSTR